MKTKLITKTLIISILAIMLSIGFTIPFASSSAPMSVTIDQAISFQDEGTLTYDDTTKIQSDDGIYGPTPTGTVIENYYACGTSTLWFDAISVHFDLSGLVGSLDDYYLKLILDLQKGDYYNNNWQYYMILQGDKNPTTEDSSSGALEFSETKVSPGTVIRLEVPVESIMIVDGWVTIRLWNARVDYVELELTNKVNIDIKPGSWPNPINVKSKGVLPVAICGTRDFDVTQIDPETIRLEGVAPLRWSFEDVATPYTGGLDGGHELEADGYLDLVLHFNTQEMVTALGSVNDGDVLNLILTGDLKPAHGGTPIQGEDTVVIKKKGT